MHELHTVDDIMTRQVATLREEDCLSDISTGMAHFGWRHIPVVDGDKLVGLIAQRDMLASTPNRFERDSIHADINTQREASTLVGAIMTRDVQTVRPETPLREAARIMLGGPFGCLPVTHENGTLVGIVTGPDFLGPFIALVESADPLRSAPDTPSSRNLVAVDAGLRGSGPGGDAGEDYGSQGEPDSSAVVAATGS